MPTVVFTNAKVLVDGYDMSADLNQAGIEYSAEMLDGTTFGETTRQRVGGLLMNRLTVRGFVNVGTGLSDDTVFNDMGVSDIVVSVYATPIIEGSTSTGSGYAFKADIGAYSPGGRVGELLGFSLTAEGRGFNP